MTSRPNQPTISPTNTTPAGKNQPTLRVTSPKEPKSPVPGKTSNTQFKESSSKSLSPMNKSPQSRPDENLDTERRGEIKKPTLGTSSKNTPADNKKTSTIKGQSAVKEDNSAQKTLPLKEREISASKERSTSKKDISSVPKTPGTDSRQQQLNLEPQSGGRLPFKSVDKDIGSKSDVRSADRNLKSRTEGKLSSRSENILGGKNKDLEGAPIIEEFQEGEPQQVRSVHKISSSDLKKNLSKILDDQNTNVRITAKVMQQTEVLRPSTKSTSKGTSTLKEKSQQQRPGIRGNQAQGIDVEDDIENFDEEQIKVEDEQRNNIVPQNTAADQNEEAPGDRSGVEGGKIERKEYSLYEDWRILETISDIIERDGNKGLSSRALWKKIVDPLTGRPLLDGARSQESMRDRFKRYIANIDEAGRETIREFADTHSAEEMRKNFSVFKKVGGEKQFSGISDQLSYNPERIQRKTPYGTKSVKQAEEKPSSKEKEKEYRKKGEGRVEDSFEEEEKREIIDQHMESEWFNEEGFLAGNGEGFTGFNERALEMPRESELAMTRSRETSKTKPIRLTSTFIPIKNPNQGHQQQQQQEGQSSLRQIRSIHRGSFEEEINQPEVREQAPQHYKNKRKAGEFDNNIAVGSQKEMKRVRMNDEFEHRSLPLTAMFGKRKPSNLGRSGEEESLMIYVDISRGFRQFVKHDVEEEKRKRENERLRQLADLYQVPLNEVVVAFRKLSFDYVDLEEYLEKKDPRMLWTEEEDDDLMSGNGTAIKYLRVIKGDDKVQKRKNYLERILE